MADTPWVMNKVLAAHDSTDHTNQVQMGLFRAVCVIFSPFFDSEEEIPLMNHES